jgi:ABC-type nitrate/sulfonate/bicarbonate transport system substrate-binding protein
MRTGRPRRLITLGVAVITALGLAACASPPDVGAGGPSSPIPSQPDSVQYAADSPCPATTTTTSVTLPEIAVSAALAWLYIDIDQEIFAKCGLKVNSATQSAQAQVSTYLAGDTSLRVSGGGLPASIAATKRPLGIYGVDATNPIFYFLENPSITSPASLKGKTIAVLSPVDSTYKIALIYLKQVGIDPGQVHFTYVSTNPNISAALSSGAAQAAVLGAPYAQLAMAHGAKMAYDFTKSSVKIPTQPIVADPSWVNAHTDVALNILRAIMAGVWIAQAKPDVAQASLTKHLKLDTSTNDGKVLQAASVYLAATVYQPVQQILAPDATTVDPFEDQAPADIQAKLKGIDMSSFIQTNLGGVLLKQGLVDQLQKLYGSPDAKSTMSPTTTG